MTDNMKKFLEAVSSDREYIEKLKKAETPEAVAALAAEKGFTLTAEDLEPEKHTSEVSDEELDAVAGGSFCFCALAGGGERSEKRTGEIIKDDICWCACYGEGLDRYDKTRCTCYFGGGGEDYEPF